MSAAPVHVADQKQALAAFSGALRARVFGDQIAGASGERLHRDPVNLEAESFKFEYKDVLDGFNAGQMHGAAVDVDDLLEEGLVDGIVRVDGGGYFLFLERNCRLGRKHGHGCEKQKGNGCKGARGVPQCYRSHIADSSIAPEAAGMFPVNRRGGCG